MQQIFVTYDIPLRASDMNKEINISLKTLYIDFCIDVTDKQ
jgi:hypothetical protein